MEINFNYERFNEKEGQNIEKITEFRKEKKISDLKDKLSALRQTQREVPNNSQISNEIEIVLKDIENLEKRNKTIDEKIHLKDPYPKKIIKN